MTARPRKTHAARLDARLSDADWKVMDALWRRERATAREVHDELLAETSWAYTTVKTMLDRLVEKGVVGRASSEKGALEGTAEERSADEGQGETSASTTARPEGSPRAASYRAVLSRNQARLQAARSLVDRAFGGAVGPLVHFLLESERLTDDERAELAEKLASERAPARPAKPQRRGRRP